MLTVSYDIVPIVFMEDDFGDLILNLILNIIFKFLLMKNCKKCFHKVEDKISFVS